MFVCFYRPVYGTPLNHPIDGDGMICSITFCGRDSAPHFRSKYVKTSEYEIEKAQQKCIFRGMMGTQPPEDWKQSLQEWYQNRVRENPSRAPDASLLSSALPRFKVW